jgi:hypothetical protein
MKYPKRLLSLVILVLCLAPFSFAEDYNLQYFLSKSSSKTSELSKEERTGLLNQMDRLVEQAKRIHTKLSENVQTGEIDFRYQEGKFWMTKLEEDQGSIETVIQQLKLLRKKPTHLVASISLYKSLKDLSSNFSAYNNVPSFSALVGDLAPEMELWVDPIFYKLYLLPLARAKDKDIEKEVPQKQKKPVLKGKKP